MRVYLDHAATTTLRPEARDAWLGAHEIVGNPSSVHGAGQNARRALEDARESLAAVLGCDPIEVVFTSGGTESVNLAVTGLWRARRRGGAIVLPDGEHHATLDTVAELERAESARVVGVGIDRAGRIDADAFAAALSPDAAVATALVANNEVGTLNDAARLARAAAAAAVPLHLDAVAAFGQLRVDFAGLRGDAPADAGLVALSISGHKVGAPAGTGALVVARGARLAPLLHGGSPQRGLRAGTQDVAGAAALAAAAAAAEGERAARSEQHVALRGRLVARLAEDPRIRLLGDPERRLPGNVHLFLPGAPGESMLFLLDAAGVSASTGSACQAGVTEASHVVAAMGLDEADAPRQVLRLTMGRDTTPAEIDRAAEAVLYAYRRLRPAEDPASDGS
ncbi:cysteine desulfurase family protein [Microbacterium excoecariae]|uniref:cysteine desulfurase family protein n=1 Tax=Microbacterium excoecariae TaxID=2715210 RepID=UPI001408187E|nr:cysteine desulfurase family protein [Microbacterium excoecariae]NHI16909.1 cysteine desulfurase [Microbacterium excoecariae]